MNAAPQVAHRRAVLPAAGLVLALSLAAPLAMSQTETIDAAGPAIETACLPAALAADHAINTKGTGGTRTAPLETSMAARETPKACPETAEPATSDHAIHPACQNAADKIACNRIEDSKLVHKTE